MFLFDFCFTYLTTGENYNDLVTNLINNERNTTVSLILPVYYFITIGISFFCVIPVIIVRFEGLYHESEHKRFNKTIETKSNAIIASFIILDIDNSETMSKTEFEQIFALRDVEAIAPNLSLTGKTELSLPNYVDAMLTERLVCDTEREIILTSKLQSYLECKWIHNSINRWFALLFGIMPALVAGLMHGLGPVPDHVLVVLMVFSYCYNLCDVVIKMYALGGAPFMPVVNVKISAIMYGVDKRDGCFYKGLRFLNKFNLFRIRYFNYADYDDPPYVQWCEYQKKLDEMSKKRNLGENGKFNVGQIPVSLFYLDHSDWKWCHQYLSDNSIPYERSLWQRKYDSRSNWFDFGIMLISGIFIVINLIWKDGLESLEYQHVGYLRMWLLAPLLRALVLLKRNKIMFYELTTVISLGTVVDIFVFMFIYIFIWARLGVTLFYGLSANVPEVIYSSDANTAFDSLLEAILALLQVTIGDSWGDIMYINVIAANDFVYIWYFASFVLVITLLVVNIIIGIILTGVDTLENQMNG